MSYREHRLKISPQYYEAWESGVKCFELRKDNRDYQVGDFVWLCEWDGEEFTGRSFSMIQIAYILRDCPEYGLMDGYCILGFARPPIEAEPIKHGMWIEVSDGLGYVGEPCEACSVCGMQTDYPSNYCPNCGAKMDEVEE